MGFLHIGDRAESTPQEAAPAVHDDRLQLHGLRFALAAAGIYFTGVLLRDTVLVPIIRPRVLTAPSVLRFAVTYEFAATALILPAVAVVLYGRLKSSLAGALRVEDARSMLETATVTIVLSFFMDRLGLWPYSWRIPTNASVLPVTSLFVHGQWVAIGALAVRLVVLTPLVEEVVFRYGLLQLGLQRLKSVVIPIVLTSALFGFLHVGAALVQPTAAALLNVVWLVVFSGVLATVAVRRSGNITAAIAAHATRNLIELATLLLAIHNTL